MEVRCFRVDEREELLRTIQRLWNPNHIYYRDPRVLEHLVLRTPYRAAFCGQDCYSFLGIWDQTDIVGLMGAIPQELNLAGEKFPSMTSTIWIADRSKNLDVNGYDLYDYIFSEHPEVSMWVVLGLSSIAYKIDQRLGWKMIDNLPRWVGINRFEEAVQVLLKDDRAVSCLPRLAPIQMQTSCRIQVDSVDMEKWDRFYYERIAPVTLGTCRDAKFLRWRYLESPVLRYRLMTVEDCCGNYLGLAVFRVESILEGRYAIGRIVEFISVNAEASVVLANSVIAFDPTVLMWDFYCLSDETVFGLESIGFRKIPYWMDEWIIPTRFQPIDYEHLHLNGGIYLRSDIKHKVERLSNRYQWYVTRGDSDQDRAN